MQKKVVLVFPSYDPGNPYPDYYTEEMTNRIPMGLISMATYAKTHGYGVIFIDGRNYQKEEIRQRVWDAAKDALCVGFSVMTPQIRHAYFLTKVAKESNPKIPVVWGGIHPTLFPEQTCRDPHVDFVIQGEADYAFTEFLDCLSEKRDHYSEIKNLVYKDGQNIYMNPIGSPIDMNNLPDPDYEILEMDKYIPHAFFNYDKKSFFRCFDIHTSRGCHYHCSFCATILPAFKCWRPLSPERVIGLIELGLKKYKADYLWFVDDYFFGKKTRAIEIFKEMKKRHINIPWETSARVNIFGKYLDDESLRLMKDTGCHCLGIGIESGSERVLQILNKHITIPQIFHTMELCKKYNIIPKCFFMTAIPGETVKDAIETIKLIFEILKVNDRALVYTPGIFRPYPGTDIYQEAKRGGFKEPESLESWDNLKYGYDYYVDENDIPWADDPTWYINMPFFLYNLLHYRRNLNNPNYSLLRKIAGRIAEFRLKHNFWYFSLETYATKIKKNLEKKPLLKKIVKRLTRW